MDVFSNFDRLVAELSKEERLALLEKINSSTSITRSDVGIAEPQEVSISSIEEELTNLNFFKRLMLIIKSLFKGISLEEALIDDRLVRIRREIESIFPNLIDFKDKIFLTSFRNYILDLKTAADFFRPILVFAFENKRELFLAYMVNSELQEVHLRIKENLDPERIKAEMMLEDKYEIKREMEKRLKDIIESISPEEKKRIYKKILFLYGLYRLSTFDFTPFVKCFEMAGSAKGCPFRVVSSKLTLLGDILFNFRGRPRAEIFEVLFLFTNKDMMYDKDTNLNSELAKFVNTSMVMLEKIKRFSEKIPLVQIIRFIKKEPGYLPNRKESIDDWFYSFKAFWDRWLAVSFKKFSLVEDRKNIIYTICEYLRAPEINYLENYRGDRVEFPVTMGFLNTFFEYIFVKYMNRGLKILLVNGDFYKEANRNAFTDSYNWLNNLDKTLESFDAKMDKLGEIGKEIKSIENEITPLRLKEKKIGILLGKADREAEEIINKSTGYMLTLIKVLEGILYGEVGGEYDTISNFTEIGGRENSRIIKSWKETLALLDRAVILLKDSYNIESSYWKSVIDSDELV